MQINTLFIISIITAFQLLLLTFVLLTYKKGKRTSNRILSAFMLANGLFIINFILFGLRIINASNYPNVFFIGLSLYFLLAPLLYLYTKSLCFKNFVFKSIHVIHFLPFIFFSVFFIIRYHIRLTHADPNIASNIPLIATTDSLIQHIGLHLQIFCYIIATLILLFYYRSKLKEMYSSIENINLSWLLLIFMTFILMWVFDVASWIITLAHVEINSLSYILALLSISTNLFFATAVVYKGLKQPEFFSGIEEKPKYAQSKLSKQESEEHVKQLLQFMKNSKPYLEPSLSLTELAENLEIHPRYLSQEINDTLNQNFYDFVNRYRIEEAKKLFADPVNKRKTVLEILYEVGFNSKSVFNNAFKKHTGITPTQFKNNN